MAKPTPAVLVGRLKAAPQLAPGEGVPLASATLLVALRGGDEPVPVEVQLTGAVAASAATGLAAGLLVGVTGTWVEASGASRPWVKATSIHRLGPARA